MAADLMLRWMSETTSGSVRELRQRLAWLARTEDKPTSDFATGRWVRDMSALGHLEVSWNDDRWWIAPRTIVRLPATDGTAVLVGARAKGTSERLSEIGAISIVSPTAPGDLLPPASQFIAFDSLEELAGIAADLGAVDGGCAATRLIKMLPQLLLGPPAAPPATSNATLERLVDGEGTVSFEESNGTLDGLYRLRLQGRLAYLYRQGGAQWRHCDLPTGLFWHYSRTSQRVFRWRPQRDAWCGEVGTIFVDWGAPLPPIHARALTLCSGLLPRYSSAARTAIYTNVPHPVAAAVASSLEQPLQLG